MGKGRTGRKQDRRHITPNPHTHIIPTPTPVSLFLILAYAIIATSHILTKTAFLLWCVKVCYNHFNFKKEDKNQTVKSPL